MLSNFSKIFCNLSLIDTVFHKGKRGETYNIGGKIEWTNMDMKKALCKGMDKHLERNEGESEKYYEEQYG